MEPLRRGTGEIPDDRLHRRGEILHPHGAGGGDPLRALENLRRGREGAPGVQSCPCGGAQGRAKHQDSLRDRRRRGQARKGAQAAQDLRLPLRAEGRDALRHFAPVRDPGQHAHGRQPRSRPPAHAPRAAHPRPPQADRFGGRERLEGAVGAVSAVAQQRGRGGHGLPHRTPGRDVLFALAPLRDYRRGARGPEQRAQGRRPEGRGDDQGARTGRATSAPCAAAKRSASPCCCPWPPTTSPTPITWSSIRDSSWGSTA